MNRLDDFDFDSIGKPMPGVTLKLADDGEILAKGENVFSGYYKDEAATKAVFDDEGWFHTGDLGEWTDKGFVKFKGRKKEIIVTSGGKNISPAGIEAMFVGNPFIENVVVYGDEHKYLVAMITLNELVMNAYAKQNNISYTDLSDLIHLPQVRELVEKQVEAVNSNLASYETIKKWYLHDGHLSVEAGHLTPSLKLRRSKVWEAFGDKLEALY
jgi:long-chain acyl-CoA synthetase